MQVLKHYFVCAVKQLLTFSFLIIYFAFNDYYEPPLYTVLATTKLGFPAICREADWREMWSCADRPFTSFFLQATREAHFSSPPIRYEATEKILWSSKSYQLYGLNARIMSSLQTAKSARGVQCLQSEACVVTTFCQGFDVRKLFNSWITKYNHFFLPFSFNSSISLSFLFHSFCLVFR